MNFNNHSKLEGLHAFLGASKYHWINYSEEKVADTYLKFLAVQKGTTLYLYEPYEKLGGNGSAKRVMQEVDKLPIHKFVEKKENENDENE